MIHENVEWQAKALMSYIGINFIFVDFINV